MGYNSSFSLPPVLGVSCSSIAAMRFVSALIFSSESGDGADVDCARSSEFVIRDGAGAVYVFSYERVYGSIRYAIITGLPFWNDLMYIKFSAKQSATDNPVPPIGTFPMSNGDCIEYTLPWGDGNIC